MKNPIIQAILLNTWIVAAAMLMVGCASTPVQRGNVDFSVERAEIKERLREVFDAAEKKDFARLDSYHFYGPTFTKFSAASPNRQDTNVAREGEHKGLAAISDLKMRPDDLKIDVLGNVAVTTFVLSSSYKALGAIVESRERSTLVFIKDQGAWKITHEHFSAIKGSP